MSAKLIVISGPSGAGIGEIATASAFISLSSKAGTR